MPVIVKWYGRGVVGQVNSDAARALDEAGRLYVESVRRVVGVQGSETDRSKPGEAPRRQSGTLQGSFQSHATRDTLTVTSDQRYAQYLSDGTPRMAPRPYRDRATAGMAASATPPPPEASRAPGVRSVWRQLLSAVVGVFRRA